MANVGERPVVPGFTIRGRIGSGATATVWWAQDRDTGDAFALKVASRTGAAQAAEEADAEAREIALLRRLDHPHIVRMHRVVDLPDGGRALVLELAALNLGELLAQGRELSLGEVVGIMAPVAGALAYLHSRGIVHGDVAPGNILLTESGRPLLADLGVARVLGGPGGQDVVPPFQTPGFGAPELRGGGSACAASDVWSLGMILERLRGSAAGAGAAGADRLAQLAKACTATDPLSRPAAALVERVLRLVARAAPLDPAPAPPPERAVTRRVSASHGLGVPAARGPQPQRANGLRWLRLPRLGWIGALLVCVSLSAGAAWARFEPSSAAVASRPSAATSVPGRSAGTDPVAAVHRIADGRAKALAAASTAGLGSADLPRSEAWRTDTALVRALRADGVRLTGLRFTVAAARLVRWRDGAAVVRVTMVVSQHRRVGPGGTVVVPARRTDPVDLVLVEIASGAWRLRSIESAPGPRRARSGSGT